MSDIRKRLQKAEAELHLFEGEKERFLAMEKFLSDLLEEPVGSCYYPTTEELDRPVGPVIEALLDELLEGRLHA